MKRIGLLILGAVVGISSSTYGQFSVNADIRTRSELRNGYMQPAVDSSVSAFFISQRTRLTFDYKKEKLALRFGIQDIRVWGQDNNYTPSGTFGDSLTLFTSEAWAQYNFTDSTSLKIGRQIWAYDEHRLLSSRDWNQKGVFYDGLLFSKYMSKWQFDVGASFNNTAENLYNIDYYSDKNRFQTLNFIYIKHKLSDKLDLSGMYLNTGYNNISDMNRIDLMHTGGLNINYKNSAVKLHAEGYYQFGKNNKTQDVNAYFVTAGAETYLMDKKLTLGAGIDYFSGHDASNTDADYKATDHTFDILYGARFKYYGYMNEYMFVGKPFEQAGLQDINFTIKYRPVKRHIIKTQAHIFSQTADFAAPASTADQFVALDKYLGTELDLMYIFAINKYSKLNIGAAYYINSDSFENIKKVKPDIAAPSYYAWVSIQFKPEIFNSDK